MNTKEKISVVWLKRDLRLEDNEAIFKALETPHRVLFLYVFENMLLNDEHYSDRHWNFIKQSLHDINCSLTYLNTRILCVNSDIFAVFNQLQSKFFIDTVFSHQETGLLVTYKRDKEFTRYCRNNSITWHETINNGVLRGLTNREDWFENWERYMQKPLHAFEAKQEDFIPSDTITQLSEYVNIMPLSTPKNNNFQLGGSTIAWQYANSFFTNRCQNYMNHISKPLASRTSCSRLSPYISWGNISIRQVYQSATKNHLKTTNRKHITAFISRLRWQAHFIQKFEMEHTMEEASINKGYHKLKKSISETYITAWKEGQTGFPLVDAAMRCLKTTGYINFRMRAMLVSFFTHILWQPWQEATQHLSSMFLDFEPGIHFPQLQMQAGETGINELRIYNPIKNSHDHDTEAEFIKQWVPELKPLETHFVHEPYLMTTLDQQFANFFLGRDYPFPIVNLKDNRKKASDILWNMKKNNAVIRENTRIILKHTLRNKSRHISEHD